MITISNLSFTYPESQFHLNIPDLSFKQSETVAVIGDSGSGKTTLLNLIGGLITNYQGSIKFDSLELNKLNQKQLREYRITNIGFIFQDLELIEYLSVLENIIYPYRLNSVLKLKQTVIDKAKMMAHQLKIDHRLNFKPKHLSQGQKQRVCICRSLITQPTLILADEAIANLDPNNRQIVIEFLFEYIKTNNSILIFVTHNHHLLELFDVIVNCHNFIFNSHHVQ